MRGAAVTWALRKQLRQACVNNEGYLGDPEIVALASLTQAQLVGLTEEFPQAAFAYTYQPLLRVIGAMSQSERASISKEQGGGWLDWSGSTKQRLSVLLNPEDVRRAHIFWQVNLKEKPAKLRVFFGPGPVKPAELACLPRRVWDDAQGRYVDATPNSEDRMPVSPRSQ
jgi:hypothetical protein